jgi:hypothetical protein
VSLFPHLEGLVIEVCINDIIPMASECFICINIILDIILNINNFLISLPSPGRFSD